LKKYLSKLPKYERRKYEYKLRLAKKRERTLRSLQRFLKSVSAKQEKDSVTVLITCREWQKIQQAPADLPHQFTALEPIELEEAARLFIQSIPVKNKLKASHFGNLNAGNSVMDIAKALAQAKSKTIAATRRIPGLIKELIHGWKFTDPEQIKDIWDKPNTIERIHKKVLARKYNYTRIKEYILRHNEKNRDQVIDDLTRRYDWKFRLRWTKDEIVTMYDEFSVPNFNYMWTLLQHRSQNEWHSIVDIEMKRDDDWSKDVQSWKQRWVLSFPDPIPRYPQVMYATVEVIRRALQPKRRAWGDWESLWVTRFLERLCGPDNEKNLHANTVDQDVFKQYWETIQRFLLIMRETRSFFDTGRMGPCLLYGLVDRDSAKYALQGERCPDCNQKLDKSSDVWFCETFPARWNGQIWENTHPEVPINTFLIRFTTKPRWPAELVFTVKVEEKRCDNIPVSSGFMKDGKLGFVQGVNNLLGPERFVTLPELIMQMPILKYVYWPKAPESLRNSSCRGLEKEFCYTSSFIPA